MATVKRQSLLEITDYLLLQRSLSSGNIPISLPWMQSLFTDLLVQDSHYTVGNNNYTPTTNQISPFMIVLYSHLVTSHTMTK